MFTSLDEAMKHDDALATSHRERMLKWWMMTLGSVLLFGGLYYAVRLLS
jgi:hypothetical protein